MQDPACFSVLLSTSICMCAGEKLQGSMHSSGPTHGLTVGCNVRVALDIDVFKQMQAGHGGWNDQMAEVGVV